MELIVVRPEDFGQAALDALGRALVLAERPCLGLPTGSTPVPLYRRLSQIRFVFPAGTRAFALDEYITARAGHPGTNASFFRHYWPDDSGSPPVAVPRADAAEPLAEIERHCREIQACGGLDIAVLGIGVNGHIAFNEPGSELDSGCRVVPLAEETRAASASPWPEGAPKEGMTLGVREIMATQRVILLASGGTKRQVIAEALNGPVTSAVPASYLQQHPALTVVCDTEAWGTPNPPSPFPRREGGA